MKVLRWSGIAAVICFLYLFGMVNSSQAAQITSFSVYGADDYGGGAHITASLSTDADIYSIGLYVKQTYPKSEADDDWIRAYSNMYVPGTRSVYEYLDGSYDGHIKIAEYQVKAEVWFRDADGNPTKAAVTNTTGVSVYKPNWEFGYKESGVLGLSMLTAHYFDGSSIIMDGYVWASNPTRRTAWGSGRFRHTVHNKPFDELEQDLPPARLKQGDLYSYGTRDWGAYFNFDTGGELMGEDEWVCDAYLRLIVSNEKDEDHWWAGALNTFNRDDNP